MFYREILVLDRCEVRLVQRWVEGAKTPGFLRHRSQEFSKFDIVPLLTPATATPSPATAPPHHHQQQDKHNRPHDRRPHDRHHHVAAALRTASPAKIATVRPALLSPLAPASARPQPAPTEHRLTGRQPTHPRRRLLPLTGAPPSTTHTPGT